MADLEEMAKNGAKLLFLLESFESAGLPFTLRYSETSLTWRFEVAGVVSQDIEPLGAVESAWGAVIRERARSEG